MKLYLLCAVLYVYTALFARWTWTLYYRNEFTYFCQIWTRPGFWD